MGAGQAAHMTPRFVAIRFTMHGQALLSHQCVARLARPAARHLTRGRLQAWQAYTVGTSKQAKQVTLRNVPPDLDQALRRLAHERNTSLNGVLLEALAVFVEGGRTHHDLDALIGTWVDDPTFDEAILVQARVDQEL